MTPAEKWQRLTNPTCVEDYGLSMSIDEIRQVPEAEAAMKVYLPPISPPDIR